MPKIKFVQVPEPAFDLDEPGTIEFTAERALADNASAVAGKPYFITNGEPVPLWNWINSLLIGLKVRQCRRR